MRPERTAPVAAQSGRATDCEERKDAWDNFAEVATIAADATSYVYTLPAALKADGVYFRFFLAKTGELPYAA